MQRSVKSVARKTLATLATGAASATLALTVLAAPGRVLAQDADALETRLTRLERAVAGQGLLELANQVAELQRDLRLMRGELEKQAYFIEQLRKAQSEQAGTLGAQIDTLVATQAELAAAQAEYAEALSTLSKATAAAGLGSPADTPEQGERPESPTRETPALADDAGQREAPTQTQAATPDSNAVSDAAPAVAVDATTAAEAAPSPVRNVTPTVPMAAVLQGGAGISPDVDGPLTEDAGATVGAGTAQAAQESPQAASVTAAESAGPQATTPAAGAPASTAGATSAVTATADADPEALQTDAASLTPPEAPNQVALTGVQQTTTRDVPSEGASVKAEYQDAFALLKSGDYPAAIVAFREFLLRNPQSEYADNAQYWLGESFYVTEDYPQAISEYQTLLDAFPDSQKYTHALLKIGYAQEAMGEQMAARNTLDRLTRDYPNTTAARLAAERLRQFPAVPVEPEVVPAPAPVATGAADAS